MERLLEETTIFDVSLDDYDSNFGQRWTTIQAQMNQVLFKQNSQQCRVEPVRFQASSKNSRKPQEAKVSPKLSPKASSTYTKRKVLQQKKSEDDRLKLSNYYETSSKNLKRENYVPSQRIQKEDKSQASKYVKKLELMLLQQDEDMYSSVAQSINADAPKNKSIPIQQNNPAWFLNYSETKKDQKVQRELNNKKNIKLLSQDLNKLIITKKIHTCTREQLQKLDEQIKNARQNEYDQPDGIDESHGSHGSSVNESINKSCKVRRKSSFETLGNGLNNMNQKRRNSIESVNLGVRTKKIKTVTINIHNDFIDKKTLQLPIIATKQVSYQRKSDQQLSLIDPIETENQSELGQSQYRQKLEDMKIHLKNLQTNNNNSEVSQNGQSYLKKFNLPPNSLRSDQYKHQISDLKIFLKNQNHQVKKILTERKCSNASFHLPQLKHRSQSENKQNKKSSRKDANQPFQVQFVKQGSQLNFKILLSKDRRQNTSLFKQTIKQQKQKIKELNLILKRDKKNGSEIQSRNSQSKQRKNETKTIKKVPLSHILNGKFKVEDGQGKELSCRKIVSKSCFFTNYKSPLANQEIRKQKENVQMKESTVSQGENVRYHSNSQNSKNISKITFGDQNPIHSSRNNLSSANRSKAHTMGKENVEGGQRQNKKSGKGEKKWQAKNIEPNRGNYKETLNEDFSIKKNLNAENNISLFKLSLNRNQHKLVIMRR